MLMLYQFTLGYDNLKLEKLNSGVVGVENFGLHKMDDGWITTSWNQASVGSQQLAVGSRQPSIILFNIDFTASPLSDNQFELFQNQPNPFHDRTIIGFYLPGDAEIELVLRDETGRILKTFKEARKGGYNTIQLEEELTNGFIYYQLSTKFGTKAKKMLQLK